MKHGERMIKFDESFVQRVLHARYQRPGRKDIKDLYLLKPWQWRFLYLGIYGVHFIWNQVTMMIVTAHKEEKNLSQSIRARDLRVSPAAAEHANANTVEG